MVNIVTLTDGKKYMLDVGFGANGPIRPLLLDADNSQAAGVPPSHIRLVYANIPGTTDPDQKLWIYQHHSSWGKEWVPMYCFTELEFLPQDYEIMNLWTSQSRKTWFTYSIVATKMIMEEGEVVGEIILSGAEVKRRMRGDVERLRDCKSEEDRVEALERWFGVKLTDGERKGVKGMVTALKG